MTGKCEKGYDLVGK